MLFQRMLDMTDEQNTVQRLIAGDVKAFEKVFRDYSRELYFVALGLSRDQAVAEDAVQESFVYLWSHREQINVKHSLVNYLRKMVRNYVLNYMRHQKVRAEKEADIIREQVFLNEEEEDITPKIEAIRSVVDSLPEGCRKIFVMAVIEGVSYAETAESMGVAVNTVKSQVRIAYKKIKESMQNNPDNMALTILFLLSLKKML